MRGQRAVVDRIVDARQVLRHHPAGADIHVADFGIAHLPVGQADGAAGGLQQGVRALGQHAFEIGGMGRGDRVVGLFGRQPQPSRMHSTAGRGRTGMASVSRQVRHRRRKYRKHSSFV